MFRAKTRYEIKKKPAIISWSGFLLFLALCLWSASPLEAVIKSAASPILSSYPTYPLPSSPRGAVLEETVIESPAAGSATDSTFSYETPRPYPEISRFEENPSQVNVTIVVDDLTQPVITIAADQIETDQMTQLNHFLGRVTIKRGAEIITGDRAIWNSETNTVEMSGNITITTPDFKIIADRALINLDLYLAKIYGGQAYFPAQNYYLSGVIIERVGENTMRIKDGTATTCDGPNPPWTIHADELTVTEGGYAKATGVSFKANDLSVAYVPWFMFPVKNERQSGLLYPMVSNSSRDGFTASLPVFWATGENHDLTFTPVWRSKRGLSTTVEGRYHIEEGRGIWAYTYLGDKQHKSFRYDNSPKIQETGDRYWLRAQNQWRLGEWDLNLNLDMVSDPFYLAEFRNGVDGFNLSSQLFDQEFGNTVNEYLDPMRSNTLFAQKTDYDTLIRAGLDYTDDLYSDGNRDTVQRLPSVHYAMVGRPTGLIGDSPDDSGSLPRFSLDMRYDYFYRTTNEFSLTDETGHRLNFTPSLAWSKSLGDMATLQLGGDMNLTLYSADGFRPSPNTTKDRDEARLNRFESRLSGSLNSSLSTTFSRIFAGGPDKSKAFRHQMIPTVSFIYDEAPDDQNDLPYWDFMDRQVSRQTMRYGLQNTFVSKTANIDKDGSASGYDYFQFLKVGLWSSYELTDHLDWGRNPAVRELTTEYYEKGAGPLELDVEAFFNPYLSLRLISAMDGKSGDVTSHDFSAKVQSPRGDSLTIAYDFDTIKSDQLKTDYSEYEEIRADLGLILASDWRADFSSRYDLREGKSLETQARLMFQAQCYALGLMFADSDNDRRVGLVVDLLGLGSINNDHGGLAAPPSFTYQ